MRLSEQSAYSRDGCCETLAPGAICGRLKCVSTAKVWENNSLPTENDATTFSAAPAARINSSSTCSVNMSRMPAAPSACCKSQSRSQGCKLVVSAEEAVGKTEYGNLHDLQSTAQCKCRLPRPARPGRLEGAGG